MWKKKMIKLGVMKPKEKKKAVFQYEGAINMLKIEPFCGCTNTKWNEKTNELTAVLHAGEIPDQVIQRGEWKYTTLKYIDVEYQENGINKKDQLIIQATIDGSPIL